MKAKILKHKTLEGYHGMVLSGTLFRTGPGLVPQLFPVDWDKTQINRSVKHINKPYVESINDFDLVNVILTETI